MVLKQLDIMKDAEYSDSDSYKELINLADVEGKEDYEKSMVAPLGPGAVKTFTIDTIMTQIGGWGRFQWIALISFTLIRNMGLYTVYLFGMAMETQDLECRDGPDKEFKICGRE
jgi:hypothetical protein